MFALFKEALALGCNCFNGGQFYGTPDHNSLTVLRRYYEKYPEDADKIVLNVKGCVRAGLQMDASSEGVRWSIEGSVAMIGGKGRIDQFESARRDPKVDIEETVAAIAEHVKSGHVGGISLSEVSAETIQRAAKVAKIEAVEVELSLWSTEPLENGVLQTCAELDIPVYAYCRLCLRDLESGYLLSTAPLGRGILTGKVKSFDDIPESDFRRHLPRFQPDVFEANLRLTAEVEKLAAKKGCTPAQVAINWILALSRRPGMPRIIPIPGVSSIERLRENAVEVELTEEDMVEIERIVNEFPPVGNRYHDDGMKLLDT